MSIKNQIADIVAFSKERIISHYIENLFIFKKQKNNEQILENETGSYLVANVDNFFYWH